MIRDKLFDALAWILNKMLVIPAFARWVEKLDQ